MNNSSDAGTTAQDEQSVVERLRRWLVIEVAEALARPGSIKLTVDVAPDRQDVKAKIERYQRI